MDSMGEVAGRELRHVIEQLEMAFEEDPPFRRGD